MKKCYDLENCSSLKIEKIPISYFLSRVGEPAQKAHCTGFRSQRISSTRTGPPGRAGSVCRILSGILWPGWTAWIRWVGKDWRVSDLHANFTQGWKRRRHEIDTPRALTFLYLLIS